MAAAVCPPRDRTGTLIKLRIRRSSRRVLILAAATLTCAGVLIPAATAGASPRAASRPAVTYVPLNGDGSSWAEPAIDQFARDVRSQGIVINFSGDGSAAGRDKYIIDQNDFAATDIAFLTTGDPFGGGVESINEAYSYIPIVAGGTTFMYNLVVGHTKITNLRLSGDTITKIFTGQITNWDDPRITHDYGKQLPSQQINVVTRSDGSGATYQFTRYMATDYASQWHAFCVAHHGTGACGPTEFYPQFANSIQRPGSDQVADYLASPTSEGSIGYDEYSYALSNNIPVVKLLNSAGYYTLPTASNVAIALEAAQINEDPTSVDYLIQNLDSVYTNPDPRAYPLSSYSYLVVPRNSRVINGNTVGPPSRFPVDPSSEPKGDTLASYLDYVLCGAQQKAASLGYSPLPVNLVEGGVLQEQQIPQTLNPTTHAPIVAPIDIKNLDNCDNPTYHNGVNYLTKDAPEPSPCDKVTAPLDCTVVSGEPQGTSGGSESGASAGGTTATNAISGGTSSTTSGSGASIGSAASAGSGGSGRTSSAGAGNAALGLGGSSATTTTANGVDVEANVVPIGGPHGSTGLYAALAAILLLAAMLAPAGIGLAMRRRQTRS
jgi:ABC-type phosphate transport system substrate-binding protein